LRCAWNGWSILSDRGCHRCQRNDRSQAHPDTHLTTPVHC
jgi:hypothetical protein